MARRQPSGWRQLGSPLVRAQDSCRSPPGLSGRAARRRAMPGRGSTVACRSRPARRQPRQRRARQHCACRGSRRGGAGGAHSDCRLYAPCASWPGPAQAASCQPHTPPNPAAGCARRSTCHTKQRAGRSSAGANGKGSNGAARAASTPTKARPQTRPRHAQGPIGRRRSPAASTRGVPPALPAPRASGRAASTRCTAGGWQGEGRCELGVQKGAGAVKGGG